MAKVNQKSITLGSVHRDTGRAFKRVKAEMEELKNLIDAKQDKEDGALVEIGKIKIEFKEDLLELQKAMTDEVELLRKEVLHYRELLQKHKISVKGTTLREKNTMELLERKLALQKKTMEDYKSTQVAEEFTYKKSKPKKSFLRWITLGDSDLDLINEVRAR